MRDAWGVAVFRLGASAQPRAWGRGGGGIRSEFEELPPEACSRLPAETPRGRSPPPPPSPPHPLTQRDQVGRDGSEAPENPFSTPPPASPQRSDLCLLGSTLLT